MNLNKPVGPTSRDCVNQIERILKPVKVGHAGTLDPIASGVLLVLVGQAVRLTDAIHSLPKQYIGQFQLGATSDSSDTESAVTSLDNSPIIAQKQLLDSLSPFRGTIEQTPPKYSAVWIDGKRAHELARQGKTFEVPKRRVMVHSIELTSFEFPKFELTISCGTGTYVRSLGRDIARSLGSDAVMTRLVRTGIGPFSLSNAVDPESLTSKADIAAALLPAKLGVQHWPQTRPSESTL
ncbi:MAG: tRNA pseudouridine(55) synthase TruB, partial [Pirellula sp.]